ncbi:TrkH family potassium uptake protein [Bacillus massilinigeriensis]|uniref:TrkH family potassium uptake protein n=1 Tax=Bacillus mediterraneensis TaxID=1805474 RepID=UPI0008F90477|nr:TrkH family potassium uptake protein [Bacillus mediterraneensis]
MLRSLKNSVRRMSPAQMIILYYLVAVLISVLLLRLPFCIKEGVELSFMDALFTSVSAVSVTGLSTVNISETFTVPGNFVLMFVFQFGGIGIMTLGTFFWLILRKKIGLRERRLIMTDQNQTGLSGMVKHLKSILVLILLIELIGAIILGTYFLNYYPDWKEAYLHGLFLAISSTTNAGFDITGASLLPFSHDYFIQSVTMVLIIAGAIGFPVLIELKEFIKNRRKDRRTRLSLFTKITTVTFMGLLVFGTMAIFFLEMNGHFRGMEWHEAFFYSLFQSVSTRSAGLATMDMNDFSIPTLLVVSGLIFIGASPSSVGGGIRTTTFALNLLFLYHYGRGNRSIKLFRRELMEEDIIKSMVVTIMALILCFVATMVLTITEKFTLISIIFEVASAFGTSGLSMGITSELSNIGKMVVMILMFIGRVGIVSFLVSMAGKSKSSNYHYPKEKVIIG